MIMEGRRRTGMSILIWEERVNRVLPGVGGELMTRAKDCGSGW